MLRIAARFPGAAAVLAVPLTCLGLEVLAQTASALADLVRQHSATVLRTLPFEGKWTPNEAIGQTGRPVPGTGGRLNH